VASSLLLPSGVNRTITFDLSELVRHDKPYGPVFDTRGLKYYINVGTRQVDRSPCPPGFGCVVFTNGSVASLGYEMSYDDNLAVNSGSLDSEASGTTVTSVPRMQRSGTGRRAIDSRSITYRRVTGGGDRRGPAPQLHAWRLWWRW
jgi:hypothetical protein